MKGTIKKAVKVVIVLLTVIVVFIIGIFVYLRIDEDIKHKDYEKAVSIGEEKFDVMQKYVIDNIDAFKEISTIYIDNKRSSDHTESLILSNDLFNVLAGIDGLGLFNLSAYQSDGNVYYMSYSFRAGTTYHVIYVKLIYTGENTAEEWDPYYKWIKIADGFYGCTTVYPTYNLP